MDVGAVGGGRGAASQMLVFPPTVTDIEGSIAGRAELLEQVLSLAAASRAGASTVVRQHVRYVRYRSQVSERQPTDAQKG